MNKNKYIQIDKYILMITNIGNTILQTTKSVKWIILQ